MGEVRKIGRWKVFRASFNSIWLRQSFPSPHFSWKRLTRLNCGHRCWGRNFYRSVHSFQKNCVLTLDGRVGICRWEDGSFRLRQFLWPLRLFAESLHWIGFDCVYGPKLLGPEIKFLNLFVCLSHIKNGSSLRTAFSRNLILAATLLIPSSWRPESLARFSALRIF